MLTTSAGGGAREFVFTARDFDRIRALIHQRAGIALSTSKHEMVYSRIGRRVRACGMSSFAQYLDALESGSYAAEWEQFTNALTTNLTAFFREGHHFPILIEHLQRARKLDSQSVLTIWCSASSTGEEPYSIAIAACEAFGTLTPPVQIVATDIDTGVLATAAAGVYGADRVGKVDPVRLKKFFLKGAGTNAGSVRVRPELQKLIRFEQLNLLSDRWAVEGPLDVIFCRNVMIYFDKPTQAKILSRFAGMMKKDALLFAGHSESFFNVSSLFRLRGSTVYELI